jgi:hypothetical protein
MSASESVCARANDVNMAKPIRSGDNFILLNGSSASLFDLISRSNHC